MRITSTAAMAIALLFSATSFAQMSGQQGQGQMPRQGQAGGTMMGAQKSTQMMGAQNMNRETMRQMATMMNQMQHMMQNMEGLMNQEQAMTQTQTREMARVMEQASQHMKEMSEQTGRGYGSPISQPKSTARVHPCGGKTALLNEFRISITTSLPRAGLLSLRSVESFVN